MKQEQKTKKTGGTGFAVSNRAREAMIKALANLVAVRSPLATQTANRLSARDDFSPSQERRLERLRSWATKDASSVMTSPESNEIQFGVMGYQCADHNAASRNIGDWVQTIAMMSHLVRRPDVQLSGEDGLVSFFKKLQGEVPQNKQIHGPSRKVRLVEFNRDASAYDSIPEKTWAFVFGWAFKRPFGRLAFPYPKSVIPIFISFHISNSNHLTEEAIQYLRAHSPIGCRDWHTVRLLQERNVECYFSGCVTTTIGGLFEDSIENSQNPIACVDVSDSEIVDESISLTNLFDEMKVLPIEDSLNMAAERLSSYRHDYSKIITSRLHTFLPAESMGASVDWRPVDADDRRFDGLIGPQVPSREAMSNRISQVVEVLLNGILSGSSPDEIYALYRSEVEEDISSAASRYGTLS